MNYQERLVEKMKGSDFIFDFVARLYHSSHKIAFNLWGLYIKCENLLKNKTKQNKKTMINSPSKNEECFRYALLTA